MSLQVFDDFFKSYLVYQHDNTLQQSMITEVQFAELIQEYELNLIRSIGSYWIIETDASEVNQQQRAYE